MKHLKTYKIFESTNIIYDVEDILNELEDVGLEYEVVESFDSVTMVKNKFLNKIKLKIMKTPHLKVTIKRPYDSVDREIPGAPVPPGGKYSKDIFLWKEVKDVIIRLNQWYFQEFKKTDFKIYSSGTEFGIGWNKEEDFSGIGDLISFTGIKIIFRIK